MRIYISGAITGTEDFRERFLKAEKELIAAGHDTVNPARLNDIMPSATAVMNIRMNMTVSTNVSMESNTKDGNGITKRMRASGSISAQIARRDRNGCSKIFERKKTDVSFFRRHFLPRMPSLQGAWYI